MKKISIATISLLAIWLGGTYIIGEQTEGALQTQINKTNLIYADKGVSYKVKSYKKGFFESEAEIEVEVTDPILKEIFNDSFKPFVMNYTIEHGPLFFKNGLGFGLSKMHKEFKFSELLNDDTKKEFLKSIKDDINIVSDMRVDFTQNAHYSLVTSSILSKEEGVVYKRVFDYTHEHGQLFLVSDNKAYSPYKVDTSDVIEIWEAKAYLSMEIPEYADDDMSFEQLKNIVLELQQEVIKMKG